MKVEEQRKISIKDWRNLTEETQDVVDQAIRHLKRRETTRPAEAKEINKWKNVLKKHYVVIDNISFGYKRGLFTEAKPAAKKEFAILNDRVQLSKQQVRNLSKLGFDEAQATLKNLSTHTKMFMSTGPHGPGGGRPRGPGAGPIRGIGKKGTGFKGGGGRSGGGII
jgi:uncharacterized membrane protein YgcG